MATWRAGRTAAHGDRSAPILRPTPVPGRPAAPTTRRRAALSHTGHAATDMSGFDGEVCVRYEAVYRRAEPACGERRLLLAVLEDGVRTFLKNARATQGRAFNLRREALAWLTTEDRSDVFAFENICEALGIDAGRLRQRVLGEAFDGEPRVGASFRRRVGRARGHGDAAATLLRDRGAEGGVPAPPRHRRVARRLRPDRAGLGQRRARSPHRGHPR